MNLKQHLKDAWQQVIEHYGKGMLCSERSLQAVFYHELRKELPREYEVWVEPKLTGDDAFIGPLKNKIPDLLVTKEKEIVAYIELKYVPFGYAIYESDVQKLRDEDVCGNVFLKTDTSSGDWDRLESFRFCDCLKVFVVISKKGANALALLDDDNANFVVLKHAVG